MYYKIRYIEMGFHKSEIMLKDIKIKTQLSKIDKIHYSSKPIQSFVVKTEKNLY